MRVLITGITGMVGSFLAEYLTRRGLIVLIRTFLSFSLEIEIDGTWPWRRALASGAGTVKQATQVALEPGSH